MSKNCKIKKMNNNEDILMTKLKKKEDENKQLDEQNKELGKQMIEVIKSLEVMKNEIAELKNNTKYTSNIENIQYNTQNAEHIQNNTANNTVNNIKIVAYGKEDLSHLLEKDYKIILNKGLKSVPAAVQAIHLNNNKPENHNIIVSNMRDKYIGVYDGTDWQLKDKDDVLQDMVYSKTDILSDKFNELIDKLDEPTKTKFNRFLEYKDDDNMIKIIKDDIKLLLYNNRKTVDNTKKYISNNDNDHK